MESHSSAPSSPKNALEQTVPSTTSAASMMLVSKETIDTPSLHEQLQDLSVASSSRSGHTTPVMLGLRLSSSNPASPMAWSKSATCSSTAPNAPLTPATVSEASSSQRSPATSQASVGSIGPTTAASLMNRHYDLTPVTRNSGENGSDMTYVDHPVVSRGQRVASGLRGSASLVSPNEMISNHHSSNRNILNSNHQDFNNSINTDDMLYGEDLALPSDLTAEDMCIMPPGPAIRSQDRSRSLTSMSFQHHSTGAIFANPHHTVMVNEEDDPAQDSVELSRQYYSFISRKQYEELQKHGEEVANNGSDNNGNKTPTRTPYQPSRQEDLSNVGTPTIPPEELRSIFIPKRRVVEESAEEQQRDPATTQQHILRNSNNVVYPLDDRQWSIPSLHLATQLQGGGSYCTTTTSHCEDEDSIVHYDDESLSSRASSLYLPGSAAAVSNNANDGVAIPLSLSQPPMSHDDDDEEDDELRGNHVVLEGTSLLHLPRMSSALHPQQRDWILQRQATLQQEQQQPYLVPLAPQPHVLQDDSDDLQASDDDSDDGSTGAAVGIAMQENESVPLIVNRSHRKRSRREERARLWLQSVEADHNIVAEAASSKFLTNSAFRKTSAIATNSSMVEGDSQEMQQDDLMGLQHHSEADETCSLK